MIYLDYQATTPLAPEAREAMLPLLGGAEGAAFGNPHSSHRMGRQAAAVVEVAQEHIAALFPPGGRIIITSSACEAVSLAIGGARHQCGTDAQGGKALAYSAIEHAAVMDAAQNLIGAEQRAILPVSAAGIVDADAALPDNMGMLAIMQVNNEIGTIQPVDALARRAREKGAVVLCDAVQSFGKMPLTDEADIIVISAHKIYGPKGIAALWLRDGVELDPQVFGGRQSGGLRSGTLSPALCAGFGAAAQLCASRMEEDAAHIAALWDAARNGFGEIDGWHLNGSDQQRFHGNLNIRKEGLDVARLMSDCRDVMFSAGSACASGSGQTSHVLKAIGLSDAQAKSSIRLGFGRYTTSQDIAAAAQAINQAADAQNV